MSDQRGNALRVERQRDGAVEAAEVEPTAMARLYRATGLMLPWTLATFLVARFIHLSSDMPRDYAWLDAWRILEQVVGRPYLPAILVGAWLVGALRRRGEWDVAGAIERLRAPSSLSSLGWKPVAAAALAVVLLVVDTRLFPLHTVLDHLALVLCAVLLVYRGASAGSPKLFLGNVAMVALVFTLCSYAFTIFKAMLFQLEPLKETVGDLPPAGWLAHAPPMVELVRLLPAMDDTIIAFEEAVFGTPWHRIVAAWAAEHPAMLRVLNEVYFYLFEHMFVVSLLLIGMRLAATRTEYLSALAICYLVGGLAYFAMPAVGPLYWEPHLYTHMTEQNVGARGVAFWLLINTGAMVEGAADHIPTFGYIAAMPSLHMAHEAVMLWYARKSRLALVLSIAFTVLTFLSIQALGFHYAIDALGGFLLAAFAIFIANRQRHRLFPAFLQTADEPLPERRSLLLRVRNALGGNATRPSKERTPESRPVPGVDSPSL